MKNKILVVDDEPQIREMYSQAFSMAGYTVETAASAEEALEMMQNNSYKVLFLDLNLPGMNGVELCRQISVGWPTAICYAVTGYSSVFELLDCREAGFEDYFTKPVSISVMIEAAGHAFKKLERWKSK